METETVKTVKPDAIELWGQQRKTEIGGFYMIGPLDKNFHGCTAYVASYHDAQLIVKAWNSNSELLEALKEIMRFKSEMEYIMGNALVTPDNFLKALENAETIIKKATS